MRKWFTGLQFRLLLGFTAVLVVALTSLSLYTGYAAQREADRFQEEVEEARARRLENLVNQFYVQRRPESGLQEALEQAGSLYGWRILVRDREGNVIGDSHRLFGRPPFEPRYIFEQLALESQGQQVGSFSVAESIAPGLPPEPVVSGLVSRLNRSILWTGLIAGAAGVVLVSFTSRRVLSPVQSLTSAARALGQGDLSQRIAEGGPREVKEMAQVFNGMAENLQRAEQHRRNLIADVAHELRTPLSNIQGYLEAMKDGLLQPDGTTIDVIHQQVLHLADLLEDLRLLVHLEAGDLRLQIEPDSLGNALQRSVEAFRARADAKGVALSLELPEDLPLVSMDRTRLSQVVGNLLDNGIVHTLAGGQVTASAEVGEGLVTVSVADTGEGISPENLAMVFERFYRVDQSRTRSTGGAGLGLTIARQLVMAHGSDIRVESTVGVGTTFSFDLHISDATDTFEQ
ncbi:MAG: two-component system, OmpR family, sensor kinase [Chloroflexi bacterium]|jgi:signal transduction histidine kinase|nr:MAG: two-component system, OmpR family, sensor kinase [Chloroflexota bacterium]